MKKFNRNDFAMWFPKLDQKQLKIVRILNMIGMVIFSPLLFVFVLAYLVVGLAGAISTAVVTWIPILMPKLWLFGNGYAIVRYLIEKNKRGFIPKNLGQCIFKLNEELPENLIDKMRNDPEEDMVRYHMGLGRTIRNDWGLWSGGPLAVWFRNIGVDHPDDMSSIILTSFHRDLNGKPLDVEGQVEHFKAYWERENAKNSEISG